MRRASNSTNGADLDQGLYYSSVLGGKNVELFFAADTSGRLLN